MKLPEKFQGLCGPLAHLVAQVLLQRPQVHFLPDLIPVDKGEKHHQQILGSPVPKSYWYL